MEKVTMLGVSQSGKTCFIYAMYDFMQKVQKGFTFITNDADLDMELNDGWESIAFDGKWPKTTANTSYYDFTVMFKSRPIMEFSWCDYRGGAITGQSSEKDVEELHQRIWDSQCLILCIGADTIKALLSNDGRKIKELKRLNSFITRYAKKSTRRIPIIFALTKSDLYTVDEQRCLLRVIKDYFGALYESGSGWLFAVVPVSLGRFDSSSSGEDIKGIVAPKNIHIPVMFFLHSILKEKIFAIQNKIKGISSDRDAYRQKVVTNQGRSWWDKFWNGDDTKFLKNKITNLNNEEINISSQLDELEQAFASMNDMFSVCKIFYEGKPILI